MKQQITLYLMFLALALPVMGVFVGVTALNNLDEQLSFYDSLTDEEAVSVAQVELDCMRHDCTDPQSSKLGLEQSAKQQRTLIVLGIIGGVALAGAVEWWGIRRLRSM